MEDVSSALYGKLESWPTKYEMIRILEQAGLNITEGKYSITVNDCSYFRFQEYGGDLCSPQVEAGADDVHEMIKDTILVSSALTSSNIKHSFEIYDHNDKLKKTLCINKTPN